VKPWVTHIGELKKQFLPFRETNVFGSFLWVTIFFSMMPWNSIFPESWNHVSWVPRPLLRYFLHSAVCKCDLCQLTGTGRYFEGNWTVYWRKLVTLLMETGLFNCLTGRIIDGNCKFSWRKQGGLFTETGWSGYGNWMVYWRKLDGQLTETGRSIDGKSGLLMEAV